MVCEGAGYGHVFHDCEEVRSLHRLHKPPKCFVLAMSEIRDSRCSVASFVDVGANTLVQSRTKISVPRCRRSRCLVEVELRDDLFNQDGQLLAGHELIDVMANLSLSLMVICVHMCEVPGVLQISEPLNF